MRNLLRSCDHADLIECSDLRRKPAVHAQHLAVNDGGQGEEVEDLTAGLPHGCVAVLLLAFLIEPVHLRDLARLVVAADKGDAVGVSEVM